MEEGTSSIPNFEPVAMLLLLYRNVSGRVEAT